MRSKWLMVVLVIFLCTDLHAESDVNVEQAISKVYPSLVQIYVITVYHRSGKEQKAEAAGSGTIISPEGYVLTNHHVAGKATAITCILSTKEEIPATLVGSDALTDIAILKLDLSARRPNSPPLPVAHFGNSEAIKVGDPVLAMGCPLALSQSVTKGIVANKNLIMSKFIGSSFSLDGENVGSLVKWIGHDAQIQPGNSGGPLVNLDGEIIGINEVGIGSLSGAIPSNLAKNIATELMDHGKINRSWIGAEFQPLLKNEVKNPEAPGVLISGVIPDSPAERAGLKAGDIVKEMDSLPIKVHFYEELPAFQVLLAGKPIGQVIHFKVSREGEEKMLEVKTEIRDHAEGDEREVKEWGMVVEEVTTMISKELQRTDKKGVFISSIRPGGPADQANPQITSDDVIVEVAGHPVSDKESFLKITHDLTDGKKTPVLTATTFERKGERLITVVEVGIREMPDPAQEARKPWVPIVTQVVSKKLAKALGLSVQKGVRVTRVYLPDEQKESDFHVGDVLTHIDEQLIEASEPQDAEVFDTMIRAYRIGSQAKIHVIRDGKPMDITSTLAERPKPAKEFKIYENLALEFKARDVCYFDRIKKRWEQNVKGAIISQVEKGGWAAVGGLYEDDLIQEIDGQKVFGIHELEPLMKQRIDQKAKRIVFFVRRGIHTMFIELEPSWPSNP